MKQKAGNELELIGTEKDFLNMTAIAEALRPSINKFYHMKANVFCILKDSILRPKSQPTNKKKASPSVYLIEWSYQLY